jgi:Cu/Ag efflux pump CusA
MAPETRTALPTRSAPCWTTCPASRYSFTQPIDMRVSEMLTGVRGDLAIKVFGPDLPTLNRLAGRSRRW